MARRWLRETGLRPCTCSSMGMWWVQKAQRPARAPAAAHLQHQAPCASARFVPKLTDTSASARSVLVLISVTTQELEPSVAESFVVSPVASFDSTRLTGARGRCISPTSPPGYASPSSSASPTKNPVAALLSMKIEAFESFLDSQSSAAHFGALGQADGPKMEDMLGGCCHIRDTCETTEDEHVQVSPSPLSSKSETRNRNAYETADHERAQVSSFPPPSFCLSVCMCIQRYEAARFLSLPFFLNACTCALARIWRTQQIQQEGIPFPVSHFFLHP